MLSRTIVFCYGVVAYAAFFATILYAIGFVGNFVVPKSVDSGTVGPVGWAVVVNVLCLFLFAAQHTVMARPAFKAWWTKIVPKPVERSTFVLLASLILALTFWQWRPITSVVWSVDHVLGRTILHGLFFVGWFIMFYSSFLIDHFDLFGLRQSYVYLTGEEYSERPFRTISLYRYVRHPLMLGLMIAFWSTPTMTYGHLLFAVVTTAYIFIGTHVEERDLKKVLGEDYERYRRETPMFLPVPFRRGFKPAETTA